MAISSNLGYPRFGPNRELKRALEGYWKGRIGRDDLDAAARELRAASWRLQQAKGLDRIPSNDFSMYDHVLDTCALCGAVPRRFGWDGGTVRPDTYFAMARGRAGRGGQAAVPAMEMTKWFDTNYHYLVPEFEPDTRFRLASRKPVDEYIEAQSLGIATRPVLVGPVTFLLLGKPSGRGGHPLDLLPDLVAVYGELLLLLEEAGCASVQMDEPCLVLDLDDRARSACREAYAALRRAAPSLDILLATYFGGLNDNLPLVGELPVGGWHIDLVRDPAQLDPVIDSLPDGASLSLGVVDGRNIWATDLERAWTQVARARERLGAGRLLVAPSCSLLHVPLDAGRETELDPEIRSWLAFADQKLDEIALLARAARDGVDAVGPAFGARRSVLASRSGSPRVHDPDVAARLAAVAPTDLERPAPFERRRALQREAFRLPELPTTTIGSFPQTAEVRKMRAARRDGEIGQAEYDAFLRAEIERAVRIQEQLGLDVLVHGEFERNDMVEYFGMQLRGFAFTRHGWVQSYGSRMVKPPVIFGDVRRAAPMTVAWSRFAQSLTSRPVKGMLTGPVTILQWSFVRDDQPRAVTARQIALAIRDEVADLQRAGIRIVQIDEPAIREGLPLRRSEGPGYLRWAVDAFRLSAGAAGPGTQIHTHMCYAEFQDMMGSIAELDADVLSIETSRSRMELLGAFRDFDYPNEIGPGVYDIHSPRVPPQEEIEELLRRALAVLPRDRLWVNPDCGLKTRSWDEVVPALRNMVAAARSLRTRAAAGR